jgi:ribose transport system ATP-binding protein
VQLLEAVNVSKSFPGVHALDNVNISVRGGEILGLVGENGAGKSTLIKIIMGVYHLDSGEILINGEKVQISSPMVSRALGLNAVYQDIIIAPELSVGENFFFGNIPTTKLGLVDWNKIYSESKKILSSLGIDIDPRSLISDLSPGEQTMVTIAKIVRDQAQFVIFDEPTARLTTDETDMLFELIERLKDENLGIIYISHRLEEIFEICDKVTVLRDGKLVNTAPISDVNEDLLISWMVGRDISEMYDIKRGTPDKVVLKVNQISRDMIFEDISFELRRGEVLGLFGLIGSGRSAVLKAIFGAARLDDGELYIHGERVNLVGPYQAMEYGVALVPEERKSQGLAIPLSVKVNINISSYKHISTIGIVSDKKELLRSQEYVESMNIRTPSNDQFVSKLSGGNQQKVAIAKWLCKDADILMLDEPTTGVDVGAKLEIYLLIEQLVQQGKAVIVCSSYLPEVIGLSDRILVMADGRITGEVSREDANEELLLRLASNIPVNGQYNSNKELAYGCK